MSPSSLLLCFVLFTLLLTQHFAWASPKIHPLLRQQECPIVLEPDQRPSETGTEPSTSSFATRKETQRARKNGRGKNGSDILAASRQTPRIVNGALVTSERLRKMMAFIVDFAQPTFCSGTLISSTWVLTSAHCQFVPSSISVIIGSPTFTVELDNIFFPLTIDVDYDKNIGELRNVSRVINHPEFFSEDTLADVGFRYDIALVELSKPSSNKNTFMRLNINQNLPSEGSMSRAMGYGRSSRYPEDTVFDAPLEQVDIPIFPTSKCQNYFPGLVFPDEQVCFGYQKRLCSICFGDSGGPQLQYDINGNPVQVGITSLLLDCDISTAPTISVRTAAFIDWIVEQGAYFTVSEEMNSQFFDEESLEEIEAESPGGDLEEVAEDGGEGDIPGRTGSNSAVFSGIVSGIIVLLVVATIGSVWVGKRQRAGATVSPEQAEEVRDVEA